MSNIGMRLTPIKKNKPFYRNWWFWGIVVVVVLFICYCVQRGYIGENGSKNQSSRATSTEPSTVINESDYKSSCEIIDYKTLARNPEKYKGNNYQLIGKVIQVSESSYSDEVDMRINITSETNEYTGDTHWSDTVYATVHIPDGEDRILEDDILTFWGTCDGMYTYESVLGSSVSLPKIDIKYYEIDM